MTPAMEADIADHVWTLEELQTSFSPAHCTQPKFISLRANCDTFCAMSSDATTTLHDLKQLLKDFRDERAWAQFHDAKNLAEASLTARSAFTSDRQMCRAPTAVTAQFGGKASKEETEGSLAL